MVYTKLVATPLTAACAPAKFAWLSRVRPSPTLARPIIRVFAAAALPVRLRALAAFSAWVNRFAAVSNVCCVVSGWPYVSDPSGLIVVKGTPEHQFSANHRYVYPARLSISERPVSVVVSASARNRPAANSAERRARLTVRNHPASVPLVT